MLKYLFLMLITLSSAFAGHQFSYTYTEDLADIKVYITSEASEADIIAYKSSQESEDFNCWLQEIEPGEDELKLMKVDYPDQAELKIYFTDEREESSDSCY